MNLKTLREKKGLSQIQLSRLIEIDNAMVSRFEKYHCLPTPTTFKRICEVLGVRPHQIYTHKEVNLFEALKCPTSRAKQQEGIKPYKLTVVLPEAEIDTLQRQLRLCGHTGPTAWIRKCYADLVIEAEKAEALLATEAPTKNKVTPTEL